MPVDLALVAFAFSLGVATFFSPCAIALVPAYVGYYTGANERPQHAESPSWRGPALEGVRFGAAAASGVLGIFAIGSIAIYLFRTRLGLVDSSQLLATFETAGATIGVLLVLLGGLMLASRAPQLTIPLKAPQQRTLPSMALFGVVFAVASMGCTLPLFFGLIGAALSQPALGSVVVVLAFGTAIAGLLLAVSIALSVAEEQAKARLRQSTKYVKPASGLLLIAAGLYTINFYLDLVPI